MMQSFLTAVPSFRYLLVVLGSSLVSVAWAQQESADLPQPRGYSPVLRNLTIERLSSEDGLPHNQVDAIVQDEVGFLWFGTREGLARYDGTSFQVFQHDPGDSTSLSHPWVESLHVDSKGTLWVGTHGGGLNRFDPFTETFIRYRHDEKDPASLSSEIVTRILEDHEGILWIGTHNGLDQFDPKTGTFTHFRHDPGDPTSLSNDQVRALYEDRQGTLWVGTGSPFDEESPPGGGGLNRYDRDTRTFTRYEHNPQNTNSLISNKVSALFEDSQGVFWVGTMGNVLHRMDRQTGTFERFRYDPTDPDRLSRDETTTLSSSCDAYGCGLISFIDEDASGTLWIGAFGSGLLRYDPVRGALQYHRADPDDPHGLANNLIWSTAETRDGTRWIGTIASPFDQLHRIVVSEAQFLHVVHEDDNPNSLSLNNVSGMLADEKGQLWIATLGGGLNRFDPETGLFTHYRHQRDNPNRLSSDSLFSVYQDRLGVLWVGAVDGTLNRFDKVTGRVTHYRFDPNHPKRPDAPGLGETNIDNAIMTILEDKRGTLWVGTFGSGLGRFDHETGTFSFYWHEPEDPNSLSSNHIVSLQEDRQGILWIGTVFELDRFDPETETFSRYLTGGTRDLFEDRQGRLWAGIDNNGLHRLVPESGTSIRIGISQNVAGIEEDNTGKLWVSTFEGNPGSPVSGSLFRLDPETRSLYELLRVDGLPEIPFNIRSVARGKGGELYFGGPEGFIAFDPLLVEHSVPAVVLTGFRLFNDPIVPGPGAPLEEPIYRVKEIVLSHAQHDFTIDYMGLDYRSEAPIQYQYMLENHDNGWVEARAQRSARYSRLRPGRYVFRVRAARPADDWTDEGAAIAITVLPPLWRTWWAFGLYGLLLIAGIIAVDRLQRRRLIRKEREKARERELEQKREIERAYIELKRTQVQLIQQEKLASLGQLTAGIAHEMKNPLNFINNFSSVVLDLAREAREVGKTGRIQEVENLLSDLEISAEKIEEHGKRANGILHSMLLHARGATTEWRATELNTLLDESIRLAYHSFRAQVPDFNCTIEKDFDPSVGSVEIIPQEIGRVFLNLLSNAFYAVHEKATRFDGQHTSVVNVKTTSLNGQVEIRIEDNGAGVPDSIKEKIFEPFFTTKPTGQGTGLGLSLAYEIVTRGHRGKLHVQSEAGEGTVFTIILPVNRAETPENPLFQAEEQG